MIKLKWGEAGITFQKEAKKRKFVLQEKTGNIICQSELVWPYTQAAGSNKSRQDGSSQLLSRSVVTGILRRNCTRKCSLINKADSHVLYLVRDVYFAIHLRSAMLRSNPGDTFSNSDSQAGTRGPNEPDTMAHTLCSTSSQAQHFL